MRKLIAAMKVSVDAKTGGAEGYADWVEGWSDDYGLTSEIDACVLGGRMYSEYEGYWTALENEPESPTQGELEWARFAKRTPHYVLSRTVTSAAWPHARFLRGIDDLAALKRQTGKSIYLMGGTRTTASLIDAGLVDELRLIVYPLIAGEGTALFATTACRHALELLKVQELPGGRLSLRYAIR